MHHTKQQFLAGTSPSRLALIILSSTSQEEPGATPSQSHNAKPMPLFADNNKQNVAFIISSDKTRLPWRKSKLAALSLTTTHHSSNFCLLCWMQFASVLKFISQYHSQLSMALALMLTLRKVHALHARNCGLPKDSHNVLQFNSASSESSSVVSRLD